MMRVVFAKEVRDNLRDRRSILSAMIYPVIGPLVLGLTLALVAEWQRTDRPVELPVVGAERAPSLMTFLVENGVKILPAPADPEAAVREGEAKAVLLVSESYPEDFRGGRPARLQLLVDESRNSARAANQKAQRLLTAYGSQIGAQRLLVRGVNPELVSALVVERVDLATPGKLAASLLTMLPLFLLMATFVGGMHVAIDATAGERERGSFEPLLINPVSRWDLVAGKWAATLVFSSAVVGLTLVGFVVMSRFVSLGTLGVELHFGLGEVGGILAASLPLALLAGALQMLVATFARSFKEAQTYLSLLLFAPMLPGIALGLVPVQPQAWMMAVPGIAQQLLVTELIAGESPPALWYLLAVASSALLSAVCLAVTARLFTREAIVFGRSS